MLVTRDTFELIRLIFVSAPSMTLEQFNREFFGVREKWNKGKGTGLNEEEYEALAEVFKDNNNSDDETYRKFKKAVDECVDNRIMQTPENRLKEFLKSDTSGCFELIDDRAEIEGILLENGWEKVTGSKVSKCEMEICFFKASGEIPTIFYNGKRYALVGKRMFCDCHRVTCCQVV